MTDLVSRLRERHSFLCDEAAEEIERLHGIIADNSLLNRTDNERLRGLLGEAADDIEHWGGYASEYFKDKWHLEDDIKKYRDAALAGTADQLHWSSGDPSVTITPQGEMSVDPQCPACGRSTKRHPGYIIGNHWLESAYERICAGEAEDDVLRDYDVFRVAAPFVDDPEAK